MENNKFNVGDTVIYNRKSLTGKCKIIKVIRLEMATNPSNGVWRYILEFHPNGEIFNEDELKIAE